MRTHASSLTRLPIVSVIIPYYQRDYGILSACVKSILAQEGAFELRVVIADDESPVPADEELSRAGCVDARVRIVRQVNAGAGAARNTALDNVSPETDYIALMDSDDQWTEGYLADAVFALEAGYDLFFSDSHRYSQEKSRFSWEDRQELNLRANDHLLVNPDRELYEYLGDFFDFLVKRSSILGPSATTYRRSVAPDLRFSQKLPNGQDRLFKLHLCQSLRRIAFSPRLMCVEGEGVNIFDSASWGSAKSLVRTSSYIDLAKSVLSELTLNYLQRKYVSEQLFSARREFVASLVHLVLRRESFNRNLVMRTIRKDPLSLLMLFPIVYKAMVMRMENSSF